MKKALILALGLATLPALAGTPQHCPAPAPAPCKPACPYSFELGALYGFANDNIFRGHSKEVDTYGGDLTGVYHFNEQHSINLRFGYTFGHNSHWDNSAKHATNLHTFYLMPGYRYTHSLSDKWSAYIGGNVGAANLSLKDNLRGPDVHRKDHDSEYGFAYSGEIGLRYRLCESSELFLAYEFFGSTASPSVRDGNMHKQTYNAVRTGVNFRF